MVYEHLASPALESPPPQKRREMTEPDSNESRLQRADGGWLHYATAGAGDSVLFIHGFGLDFDMWDAQWQAFARRHRVIRYDLRGYGSSSLPEGAYRSEERRVGKEC